MAGIAFLVAGIVLVVVGVAFWSLPAASIVLGVALLLIAKDLLDVDVAAGDEGDAA